MARFTRSCRWTTVVSAIAAASALPTAPGLLAAQTHRTDDPVIHRIWEVGMEQSQAAELAHTLMDVIGPRLAGSPELDAAGAWLLRTYREWDVPARREDYGEWPAWRQGTLHVDMVAPRVATLVAELLAWTPGTDGPVQGDVVLPPEGMTEEEADAWLATLRGDFVLMDAPEPMCRAPQELEANARPETVARLDSLRSALRASTTSRFNALGPSPDWPARLEDAGVAGLLFSRWSGGWGVNKVFMANTRRAVALDISCEDYGLLHRLAVRGAEPRIRVDADAQALGSVPLFNIIGELQGSELPDEYVILSAHLDSWHAATGATDNGTGTITMLEAMRILKKAYPRPRRTILVGHWGPEEVGLTGSRSFVEDHGELLDGIQVVFNQDNGTWRFERLEGQGFQYAGQNIARWVSLLPDEMASHITLEFPGGQNNRGSDHISFLCEGVPAFRLQSPYDEYRQYTWHTNRDTYDKIVFDDLKENATVAAMLAYAASEDPERVPRDRSVLPANPTTGEPMAWVRCGEARRRP